MTTAVPATSTEQGHENEGDLMAMVEEIGTAVAAGLVPFLGQAINIYDTIESLLTLHNSQGAEAQAEAKFDLVLALVGWIPGAGGGVKKTIRIVNKNPARYAPILFDVLRMVCLKLGIQTSPETLLDKLFDAAGLKAILGTVQSSVENSWAYEQMPSEGQQALSSTMTMVRVALPSMLLLVTVKLMHWKRMQRNTAARSPGARGKDPAAPKPATAHPTTAQGGANSPSHVPGNTTGNAVLGTASLAAISNDVIGILGEHITDYFLYEEYGWGRDWSTHDQGVDGSWKTNPGKEFPGKLNDGTKLNPLLALKAHGLGIDGVWKVQFGDPKNGGKPYAIIESKSSANNKAPTNASRKPQVRGKLLSNARRIKKAAAAAAALAAAALPKTTDLLDPATGGAAPGSSPAKAAGRPTGTLASRRRQRGKQGSQQTPTATTPAANATPAARQERPVVQMSHEWINRNIGIAVKNPTIEYEIRRKGGHVYQRHLFYTPFYLPSAAQHVAALRAVAGSPSAMHSSHESHSIPSTHRHDEQEVKMAVNTKNKLLKLPLEP